MTLKSFKQEAFSQSKRGRILAFLEWFPIVFIIILLLGSSFYRNYISATKISSDFFFSIMIITFTISFIFVILFRAPCLISRFIFNFQPTEEELVFYYEKRLQELEFSILMAEDSFMENLYKSKLTEHNSLYTALEFINKN